MPDKPKVAFYWCASCGGCEESVVDLAEDILGVVAAVDIVFWPVAMDFKRQDVEAMADGSILVSLDQRRGPHIGAGGDGAAPAAQESARHRLRILRPPGRDPRPGQPVRPGADPALRLRGVPVHRQNPDKIRPHADGPRTNGRTSTLPELLRAWSGRSTR